MINIWKKKLPAYFLPTLFSPITMLFPINDPGAVGRKEILIFATYLIFMGRLKKNTKPSKIEQFMWLVCGMILVLSHEMSVFFSPYFIFAETHGGRSILKKIPPLSGAIFLGMTSAFAAIMFFGVPLNGDKMCATLIAQGMSDHVCSGIIRWPAKSIAEAAKYTLSFAIQNNYLKTHISALILGLLPILYFHLSQTQMRSRMREIYTFFFSAIFASTPLFLIAIDWGRFLHVHFMLITLYLLSNLTKTSNASDNDATIASDLRLTKNVIKAALKVLIFFALLQTNLMWSLEHCCKPELGTSLQSYKRIIIPD